jgi:hypothetical protein
MEGDAPPSQSYRPRIRQKWQHEFLRDRTLLTQELTERVLHVCEHGVLDLPHCDFGHKKAANSGV